MDLNDLHPPDDYTHRFFIWHEWIQANGPLTSENVFEYFATSMFYDKQSNNQVLRMQTMHTGVPVKDEAAELRRFTGVEFAVVHSQPPTFFIIHKRERLSPDEVRPLAAYFIASNRIYQAPDVYTVLSNRLLTSVSALQSSLDILRKYRPDYTPRTGFIWPITDPSMSEPAEKDVAETTASVEESATTGSAPNTLINTLAGGASQTQGGLSTTDKRADNNTPKRQKNNMLLMNAMATTAAHSKTSFTSTTFTRITTEGPDTPITTTMRSSATPAPAPPDAKATSSASTQEMPKSAAGGGKKKKKR